MSSDSTDIAIVGGGLIGLCAALALQHPDRRITLIEASDIRADVSGGINARSIALSASSAQIFHALSLWPELELHAAPIRTIHVSAQGRWGVTRLQASDYRLDAMGYVVEHHQLMQCLLRSVDDNPNIILQTGAEFESIDEGSKSVVGYRQDGKLHQLTSTLTLIADGARSKARDALGIEHKTIDYGQSVLICNVEFSKPGNQVAYERFTNQGPLAMLPLGGKRYACVWTLDPDRSDLVCHYDDQDFSRALQACFGFRLGNIESVGARFSIPIQRTRALQLHQGRHLLIGNAANALHPVAGQGFNLALRDIACLYELLADQNIEHLIYDQQIDQLGRAFDSQRLLEQNKVIRYGDGLVTLFSNELPLVNHMRAAGLTLLDLIPALKTQVALSGMGMSFSGNRLLRGRL